MTDTWKRRNLTELINYNKILISYLIPIRTVSNRLFMINKYKFPKNKKRIKSQKSPSVDP